MNIWPDLTQYGMQLRITETTDGHTILVVLGGDRKPEELKALGFTRNKERGLWFSTSLVADDGSVSLNLNEWRKHLPYIQVKVSDAFAISIDKALEENERANKRVVGKAGRIDGTDVSKTAGKSLVEFLLAEGAEKDAALTFDGSLTLATAYDPEEGGLHPMRLHFVGGNLRRVRVYELGDSGWSGASEYHFDFGGYLSTAKVGGVSVLPVEYSLHEQMVLTALKNGEVTRKSVSDYYKDHAEEVAKERAASDVSGLTAFARNQRNEPIYLKGGARVLVTKDGVAKTESILAQPGRFLRAGRAAAPVYRDLVTGTQALLAAHGDGVVTDGTITAFSKVLFEDDTSPEGRALANERVVAAIESVVANELGHYVRDGNSATDIFNESIKHLGRQTPDGASILPLPLAVTMSRLLGDNYDGLVDINAKSPVFLALSPSTSSASLIVAPEEMDESNQWFDYVNRDVRAHYTVEPTGTVPVEGSQRMVGTISEKGPVESVSAGFLKTERADHDAIVRHLATLTDDGRAVFMLDNDGGEGAVSSDSEPFFRYLQDHFETVEVIDIGPELFTRNVSAPRLSGIRSTNNGRRLLVVQGVRPEPVLVETPVEVKTINSFTALWKTASELSESLDGVDETIKARNKRSAVPSRLAELDAKEVKQVPYQTASQKEGPQFWSPVNLSRPQQTAVDKVSQWCEDTHKKTVDEFVQHVLGASDEDMDTLYPAQIDSVAFQAYNDSLNRGLIIGDLTGVGKGRSLAAIYRYNLQHQKRPTVFITERDDLLDAFMEDLEETNTLPMVKPFVFNNKYEVYDENGDLVDSGENTRITQDLLDEVEGQGVKALVNSNGDSVNLIMMTVSQLQTPGSLKGDLLKLIAPECAIIIDEAHNFAGQSNRGRLIRGVLDEAASVTYSSATFSRVGRQIGVYKRAIPAIAVGNSKVVRVLDFGGESMLESLCSMLTTDGALLRRENSLAGMPIHSFDSTTKEKDEKMATVFADVVKRYNHINEDVSSLAQRVVTRLTAVKSNAVRGLGLHKGFDIESLGDFSSFAHLAKQFTFAVKAEFITEHALACIKDGKKPIIGFESTLAGITQFYLDRLAADAVVSSGLKKGDPLYDEAIRESRKHLGTIGALPTFYDAVEMHAERMLSFRVYRSAGLAANVPSAVAGAKTTGKRRITYHISFSELAPHMTQVELDDLADLQNDIQQMLQKAEDLKELTGDPASKIRLELEKHTDADGKPIKVGEISGRHSWFENDGVGVKYVKRNKRKLDARDAFNGGETSALLVNSAGASGVSLHASEKFKDQRQRVSIIGQVFSNPIHMLQYLGRANRSGQVSVPEAHFVMSGVPSEKRQNGIMVSQVRKASASTTANRDNLHLIDAVDILNVVGDTTCLRYLANNPGLAASLGLVISYNSDMNPVVTNKAGRGNSLNNGLANTMLARMIMLPPSRHEEIYEELMDEYQRFVLELDNKGQNPNRIARIPGKADVLEERVLSGAVRKEYLSEFERPLLWSKISYKKPVQALTPEDVEMAIKQRKKELRAFASTTYLIPASVDTLPAVAEKIESNRYRILSAFMHWAKPTQADIDQELKKDGSDAQIKNETINWLVDALKRLDVGSVIRYTRTDNTVGTAVVMRIETPRTTSMLSVPSHYTLSLLDGGDTIPNFSLKLAQEDENFSIEHTPWSVRHPLATRIKEQTAKYVERTEWLLHGNQYEAHNKLMDISAKGEPAVYELTDGRAGVGMRVIASTTAEELTKGPLTLRHFSAVGAFLKAHPVLAVTSSGPGVYAASKDVKVKLAKDNKHYLVLFPAKGDIHNEIKNHPVLSVLVLDKWQSGVSRQSGGIFSAADIDTVTACLMGLGYDLFITSSKRDWLDQYEQKATYESPRDREAKVTDAILNGTYVLPDPEDLEDLVNAAQGAAPTR